MTDSVSSMASPGLLTFVKEPDLLKSAGAIVIGGNYRALGVVRSLGRRGIRVWVIKEPNDWLAGYSRYTRRTLTWPVTGDDARAEFLLRIASEHDLRGWVVFPTDDGSAAMLARNSESLAEVFRLATAPWEILQWAHDKRLTYAVARELNIDCPWTAYPRSRDEVVALDCKFPLILKPAYKESLNRFTAAKAWRVNDRESLLARYDEACTLVSAETVMVQELVPGYGESQFSYVAIAKEGRPIASLVARRVRQMPMDFGKFSTCVESIDDPGIVEPATRLLKKLRFTGIVEVEFKRDPASGFFKLLDVNPRVFGWHTLCARAGVDMSYLLWLLTTEQEVPEVSFVAGVRWMWTNVDFSVALKEILGGRLKWHEYLQDFRGSVEHAIFASDDPAPGLLELPLMAYKLAMRALGLS